MISLPVHPSMPDAVADGTHAPGIRRRRYETRFYEAEFFIRRHVEKFIDASLELYVFPGARVCDIGCGEQPLRARIEASGAEYVGLDIGQNSRNTVHVLGGVTDLPFGDNQYDVIICTEVLEHVVDTLAAFRELARVLKPGGVILVSTPFAYRLHEVPYDYVRLTPFMIRECAKRNDLLVKQLVLTGNELEIAGSIVEYHLSVGAGTWLRRKRALVSRLLINAGVSLYNAASAHQGSGDYFFSSLCVLQKPGPRGEEL